MYVPDITPAPFSLLRQVAYGQKKILPRPDVDPSGWHTSLPVVVKGQLLADPDVRLYCTVGPIHFQHITTINFLFNFVSQLSLANPVSPLPTQTSFKP